VITGVSRAKLAPNVDEPNLKTDYLNWLNVVAYPVFGKLLALTAATPPDADADLLKAIVDAGKADDDVLYVTRSIVLLWYLGAWYPPDALKGLANAKEPENVFLTPQILSAKSYTHGWMWSVIQAHPMGYSNMQFGYWSKKPIDLEFFIEKANPIVKDPT
jgi:hypothetical protein